MKGHGLDGRGMAARVHCAGEVLRAAPQEGGLKIGYMGIGHAHDFQLMLPALVRVLQRNPQVVFELFGPIPKPVELEPFGDRVRTVEFVGSYDEFLRKLATLGWSVGICPLADTGFNRTKGNNKWVEYTSAGAAVIASAGTLYDECCAGGCGLLAANEAEWEQALQSLIDNTQLRLATVAAAQRRLAQEYPPEAVRSQLLEVFRLAQARAQGHESSAPTGTASFFDRSSANARGTKEA
jgi:glycosyltransferase involved in cell wall biosynthesis